MDDERADDGSIERQRESVLADLREVRREAKYKALRSGDGRIRDTQRASARCQYLRLLVRAASEERRLLRDRDLDELRERIEALEEAEPAAVGGVRA